MTAAALAHAVRRQRRLDALRRAGFVVLEVPGRGGAELEGGLLVRSWAGEQAPLTLDAPPASVPATAPLPRHLADEVATVAAWLDREAARVRLVSCSDGFTSPAGRVPVFEPRSRDGATPERTATKVLLRS